MIRLFNLLDMHGYNQYSRNDPLVNQDFNTMNPKRWKTMYIEFKSEEKLRDTTQRTVISTKMR